MYRGYNVKSTPAIDKFYSAGMGLYKSMKEQVVLKLKNYVIYDGIIDGEKIQEDWFPEINAHVFISHSHQDEKLAISLAGWLKETFALTAFVDSCIWGNSNDLLKLLDDKYCYQPESKTYNYSQRNHSTAHVHMLLMTALNKMIDKTECLLFLNTENSVSLEGIKEKTLSPWIYGEIETSRIIEKRTPKRLCRKIQYFEKGGKIVDANESRRIPIAHILQTEHLKDLYLNILNNWAGKSMMGESALDGLYELTSHKPLNS